MQIRTDRRLTGEFAEKYKKHGPQRSDCGMEAKGDMTCVKPPQTVLSPVPTSVQGLLYPDII